MNISALKGLIAMTTTGTENGNVTGTSDGKIWSSVAIFLAGVVLTGAISIFNYPRNVVTVDQLPALISANNSYTTDAASLKGQLTQQSQQIGSLQSQVMQLQVDVARISEHLGVPAHPGK